MDTFLLPPPFPITVHSMVLLYIALRTLNIPFQIPAPAQPPTLYFRFFETIYGRLFATITFPHHYTLQEIVLQCPSTPGYSFLAPTPASPSPPLPFSLFEGIYRCFVAYISTVSHPWMYIHDL